MEKVASINKMREKEAKEMQEAKMDLKKIDLMQDAMNMEESFSGEVDEKLTDVKNENEAQEVISQFFDNELSFDYYPWDSVDQNTRNKYLEELKSNFVGECLSKWKFDHKNTHEGA